MRRRPFIALIIAFLALAVALVAFVDHQSGFSVEPTVGDRNRAPQASLGDAALTESTVDAPQQTNGDHGNAYQTPVATEGPPKYSAADEAITRKEVREEVTRDVRGIYPLLVRDLNLTSSQQDALLSFLIEDEIARTRTFYSSGIGMEEQARSRRIAAIIGDSKLQQFLALERNLSAYRDVARVGVIFQQKGAPLTHAQQDRMLRIFIDVRDQLKWTPRADVERRSIEALEYSLAREDDYDRLVLELAASVLSPKQVQYLFERYQALSYWRAAALERQRQARADSPNEDVLFGYPSRSNLNVPQ